ncbi:MAG: PQQ-binding-like beta-propeller repeat protein [Verrucomicrobia bacterium]|nr:PQQ-binding-like beta-propeller repeat protein [Verrucomicrobiota bacterium]
MTNTVVKWAVAVVAASVLTQAEDWPQWGGNDPGRNMYSSAKGLPESFEPGKTKSGTEEIDLATTKNVKWVAKLGSQSYANPVVAGGKVYVGTNNESPRDKRHVGDRSILYALDEKSGQFLWQLVVPKLKSGKVNDWENLGLLAAPLVIGNRLWVVTSRCEVLCLDTEGMANGNDGPYKDEAKYVTLDTGKPPIEPGPTDADIIWRYDMMEELGVFPHNASNCSVILVDGKLFVCTSNGQDWTHVNIPSPNSPSFIALDPKTGELVGEDNAAIGNRIYHGQWTSPSAGKVDGKWQVFFGGGDGVLYAVSTTPEKGSGQPKTKIFPNQPDLVEDPELDYIKNVWWVDCVPPEYKVKDGKPIKYPAAEGPSEINSTPVYYDNKVYVAIGQDPEHGEGVGRLVCIDPAGKTGDLTKTGVVWDYKGIKRSISTVSIDPATGLLFIADFSGFVHCLDAKTGKLHWVYDMKAHMWGSTFVADGKVYVGDEDGDFVVLAAKGGDKPVVLSETNLGAPVYGTPIVANGTMYVMGQTHLFAIGANAKPVGQDAAKPGEVQVKN